MRSSVLKSSEALRIVKFWISTGQYNYLCSALNNLRGGSSTNIYKNLLEVFPTGNSVECWLYHNSEEYRNYYSSRNADFQYVVMKKYRLDWIDWLIPQYEAVGD